MNRSFFLKSLSASGLGLLAHGAQASTQANPNIAIKKADLLQSELFWWKAKKGNREKLSAGLCIVDETGALYKNFGSDHIQIQTILLPSGYQDHIKLVELTASNFGHYMIWLAPGEKDVWRKGDHLTGFVFNNGIYQCSGMVRWSI